MSTISPTKVFPAPRLFEPRVGVRWVGEQERTWLPPFAAPLDTPPVQGLFALAEAWHRLRYQLRRAEGRHKELVALVGGHLRGSAWATEQLKVHLEVYGK